jgi:hypothetical protein
MDKGREHALDRFSDVRPTRPRDTCDPAHDWPDCSPAALPVQVARILRPCPST